MHCLLTFVALVTAGCQAVHPTPRPGAESARAARTAIGALQQGLRARLATTAIKRRTTLLRGADGAVIAQEQLTLATIDTALPAGTRGIACPGIGAEDTQQQHENRHSATAHQ